MKKIALLAAAAVATVAITPSAFAAVGSTETYAVGGIVPTYCALGTVSAAGSTNVTLTNLGFLGQYLTIGTLEATPAGTPSAWQAALNFNNSLCNVDFNVTAKSVAGGLTNATPSNAGTQFTNEENYTVAVAFGTNSGSGVSNTLTGAGKKLISNGTPANGNFGLAITGNAGLPLTAGLYGDILTVTLNPAI